VRLQPVLFIRHNATGNFGGAYILFVLNTAYYNPRSLLILLFDISGE